MYHKISFFALLAVSTLKLGNCLGFCAPKIGLSPLAVSPLNLLPLGCADLCECGPQPAPLPIIQAPPITVPTVEGPIIPLPSPPIPCPRTIAHRCICTKTVVKPQLIQRAITIPTVQRYLKRTYTPVMENIAYKAKPKSPPPCTCAARPIPAATCAAPPLPMSLPYSRIC